MQLLNNWPAIVFIVICELLYIFVPYCKVDTETSYYVKMFETQVKERCGKPYLFQPQKIVKIANIEPGTAGKCYGYTFKYKILISSHVWNWLDFGQRYQLIAHELTHCMFNGEHVNDPTNYMYYQMNDIPYLTVRKQIDAFLKEKCGS